MSYLVQNEKIIHSDAAQTSAPASKMILLLAAPAPKKCFHPFKSFKIEKDFDLVLTFCHLQIFVFDVMYEPAELKSAGAGSCLVPEVHIKMIRQHWIILPLLSDLIF
jgi:hypothetical protein